MRLGKLLASLFVSLMVVACAGYPEHEVITPETPQVRLRVAADAGIATNISFMRVPEMACSSGIASLGWFHPTAVSEWQRKRREADFRLQIPVPAIVPEHMYSERVVSVDKPFFILYSGAMTGCGGVTRLDMRPGADYEFLLTIDSDLCRPRLFELQTSKNGYRRVEIPLPKPVHGRLCRG